MARQNRLDVAEMFMAAGNGHFGSCYSCAEIVTVLYFALLRVDPARPDWAERDRFILGKGHAAPTLYSGLIRRIGPARVGYISVLTPVIAMVLTTLFEGYRWTPTAASGVTLALAGLLVAMRARSPAR